jgi:hypothetical protein
MTLMDLAVVLALLAIFAAIGLNLVIRERNLQARVMQVQCATNLKAIGNQFRFWADPRGGHFPMSLSSVIDGSEEFTTGTNAWRHFRAITNYGLEPRTLICPADLRSGRSPNVRLPARDFTVFGNANLSYFVGVDATKGKGSSFLCGDRNITNGIAIQDGLLELTTNAPAGWTDEIHDRKGAVLLADGSVNQFTDVKLRAAIAKTGLATNRLQMPVTSP